MTFTEAESVGQKPRDLAIKPRLLPVLRVFKHTKTLQYDKKNKSRITPDKQSFGNPDHQRFRTKRFKV